MSTETDRTQEYLDYESDWEEAQRDAAQAAWDEENNVVIEPCSCAAPAGPIQPRLRIVPAPKPVEAEREQVRPAKAESCCADHCYVCGECGVRGTEHYCPVRGGY